MNAAEEPGRREADLLAAREARLRMAIEIGAIAVWDVDLRTGAVSSSPELNQILGFAPDARPTVDEINRNYLPGELERLRDIGMAAIASPDHIMQADFPRYRRPDNGAHRWLALRAQIRLDPEGVPSQLVGALSDITDRKQIEQDLRRSEGQKAAILDAALDAIITIGSDSRVLEWNGAAAALFGYTRAEAIGSDVAELIIPPHLRASHHHGMNHYLATGEGPVIGRRVELEGQKADGTIFPLELAISVVDYAGERQFTAYVRDLSERRQAEREMRRADERLRDITDALPILISYLDAEQTYQFVNLPYESWFGRPRSEIVGRHVTELLPPAAYEARRPFIERALAGEQVRYDVDMPRVDGTVTTEVLHVPHRDAEGRVLGMYAVVQDITARKLTETALRESELRFRQVADKNPAVIWSADADGRLTYLSHRWYDYTGLSPADPLPRSWDDQVHPDDRGAMHTRWRAALEQAVLYDVEARFLRHDGAYRWHSIRAEPLRDAEGVITGWLGSNSDIDDAVQSRQGHQRDHDRLWHISQEVMLVRDFAGTILSVNPSATRLLGWQPEDMVGRPTSDFIHPDDAAVTEAMVAERRQGDGTFALQNRYRCQDGSYRTLDWRAVAYDGLVHAVGRDVTVERQAAEELQRTEAVLRQAQKMEAVGQLTGGIAHDFNNMLAGIIGGLDIIQRRIAAGRLDDTTRFIEAAMTSANRAAALTQRLLAFGRRQSLDIRPVDVAVLLASLEDMLGRTLGPGIRLQLASRPHTWHAQVDESQLESAVLNLVINARDAMPDGGTLNVSCTNTTIAASDADDIAAGDYVLVAVADSGVGMDSAVLAKVFEPFFTTKPIGQGTGLGLSMVYGFVNQIGGHVRIDSAEGRGTTVSLYLPRAEPEPLTTTDHEPGRAPHGEGETVLVVEDDPAVRLLVVSVLAENGYRSIEAGDGEAALPILRGDERIDLLISDVGLPGVNGRQLAELARAVRPELPVLFITGYAKGAALRAGFLAPGMQMLTKPFGLDVLAHKIRDMLAG